MIPIAPLITKLNAAIASGGLSALELAQVFGAIDSLKKTGIGFATSTATLPPAANNKGRFVYISSENRYTYSNGVTWNINNLIRSADVNLYAWGLGTSGQLGDNTATGKSSPVSISGIFTDWVQVSGGNTHSLALRANGTAWAWGSNA